MNLGIIGNGFVGSSVVHGFSLSVENINICDVDDRLSTCSFEYLVDNSDVIFVCVPTPMRTTGEIDVSIVKSVLSKIGEYTDRDPIVVVKSTVVPGTCEKLSQEFTNLKIVFNPEFLTERNARLDFINTSRIVLGGDDESALSLVEELYRKRFPTTTIIKTDFASAQLIKYISNCFFATKVSFMNEMKQISDAVGADWNDVMHGFVSDGRVGNSHLDVPGHDGDLGFGGKCFPKDINAMITRCKEVGVKPTLLKAAWDKNMEVRENHDWVDIKGAVSDE